MVEPLVQYAIEYLQEESAYEKQVYKFIDYLKRNGKINQIALLSEYDVDEFIGYNRQIKSIDTMASYLEGLKSFNDFLNSKGYLNSYFIPRGDLYSTFKDRLSDKYDLQQRIERTYLAVEDIQQILDTFDTFFIEADYETLGKEAKGRYIYWLCLRIYIKISLLVPAKKSQLLELRFRDFREDFRTLTVNRVAIRIPNGLRYNILHSLDFIKKEASIGWDFHDRFFDYFISPIKISNESLATDLNSKFCKFLKDFNLLGIENDETSSSLEVLSNTTIHHMISCGTNPYYISQISGVSIGQLAKKYYNRLEDMSYIASAETEVNKSISSSEYYHYI